MIYKLGIILMVALALVYAFQAYYPDFVASFSNVFSLFIAGAAVISAAFCLRKYWHKTRERFSLIWLCFTVGIAFWFLGEVGWAVYTLVLGVEIPYPSAADVFWLAGYVPFFIALYLYVKLFGSALSRKMLATAMTLTVLLTILVSVVLINPLVAADEDLTTLAIDFAYPLLDLALLSVSLLGLLIFFKGKLARSWLLINAGIMANVCADVLFSYTTVQGTYYAGHPIDVLFDFSYMFFLLAFYAHTKEF